MSWIALWNGLEAVWWFFLAIFVAIRCRRWLPREKRMGGFAAIFLFAFGVSDVIEVFTGAWWRPFSLLVLKATCILGLVTVGALSFSWRKLS